MKLAGVFLLCSAACYADNILYSDFGPGQTFDLPAWVISKSQVIAAPFTTVAGGPLSEVDLALSISAFAPAPTAALRINLFDTGANAPGGALLESWLVLPSSLTNVGQVIALPSLLHPILDSGVQYWLELDTSRDNAGVYDWHFNSIGADTIWANGVGGGWIQDGSAKSAFALLTDPTAVPEPSTALCVSAGAAMVVFSRRRRGPATM